MKLSKKIYKSINREISDLTFEVLCLLDKKDRDGEISHDVWRDLHKGISKEMSGLMPKIETIVSSYRGKR